MHQIFGADMPIRYDFIMRLSVGMISNLPGLSHWQQVLINAS
ncbi:hypothetical protein [Shewanella sp. Bg11-22]|nr:hypothetical protein [Shewanella sp. Bg11-22]